MTNAITLDALDGNTDLDAVGTGAPWFDDLVYNTVFSVDGDGNQDLADGWKAGTSMAAPNVAGAAALVKSANRRYNANQVEAALKRAADVPEDYDEAYYGSGYLKSSTRSDGSTVRKPLSSLSPYAASMASTSVASSCTPTQRWLASPPEKR